MTTTLFVIILSLFYLCCEVVLTLKNSPSVLPGIDSVVPHIGRITNC